MWPFKENFEVAVLITLYKLAFNFEFVEKTLLSVTIQMNAIEQ